MKKYIKYAVIVLVAIVIYYWFFAPKKVVANPLTGITTDERKARRDARIDK